MPNSVRRGRIGFLPLIPVVVFVIAACAPAARETIPPPLSTTPSVPVAAGSPTPRPYPWTDSGFKNGDTVEFVSPGSIGGGLDTNSRLLAPHLQTALQRVTGTDVKVAVKPMPGADMKTGLDFFAKSKPDGRTIGMIVPTAPAGHQVTGRSDFDMSKWTWIGRFSVTHKALMVRKDLKLSERTLMGLAARSRETSLLMASGAALLDWRIIVELLREKGVVLRTSEVNIVGPAAAAAALLRSEIEITIDIVTSLVPLAKANPELEVILTTACERVKEFPDIPSLGAQNVPNGDQICNVVDPSLRMVAAPSGVPDATAATLREAFRLAVAVPEFQEQSAKTGFPVEYVDAEGTAKHVKAILDLYGRFRSILVAP